MVFSVARRVTGDHHDAEDITQTCFLDLASKAGDVHGSVAGWLHVQATNRAIDHVRRKSSRRRREKQAIDIEKTYTDKDWARIEPQLDRAIEKLPDDLRIPLILYFLENFTQDQVAEMLNLSQRTISRRLQSGVKALRAHLGEIGVSIPLAMLVPLLKQHACQACPLHLQTALGKIALAGVGGGGATGAAVGGSAAGVVGALALSNGVIKAAVVAVMVAALGVVGYREVVPPQPSCYARLVDRYRTFVAADDPLGFPLKVQSLTADALGLHIGAQDLLLDWVARRRPGWFADPATFAICHGNLHPGNVGIYPPEVGSASHEFGLIDLDESIAMPVQVELLQALASLEMIADRRHAGIEDHQVHRAQRVFLSAFAAAAAGEAPPSPEAAERIEILHQLSLRHTYSATLADYLTPAGAFRSLRMSDLLRSPMEILGPCDVDRASLASALAQAVASSPALAKACRYRSTDEFARAILGCVRRTQIDSASSQGLTKYLILLRSPLHSGNGDMIFYLKRQIPTAAERAGLIEPDPRTPARRVYENALALRPAGAGLMSWCELNGGSYTVRLREPWTQHFNPRAIVRSEELLVVAELMGRAAGAAHRCTGQGQRAVLAAEDADELLDLANDYVKHLRREYDRLVDDVRARADRLVVQSTIRSYVAEAVNTGKGGV